jgi:Cu/Zn superoxide dismutase
LLFLQRVQLHLQQKNHQSLSKLLIYALFQLKNVDSNGNAKTTLIAPRLKLADIQGLAVMIHAGGDNYSDLPKPLGGGGERIACGVIQ